MKTFCLFFVLLLLLSSCSPKLQYPITAQLTNTTFDSRSGSFSGNIPSGWFYSPDTAIAKSLEVWLLRNDLSAGIVFRELNLDQKSKEIVAKEGLEFLAEMSQSFSMTDTSSLVTDVRLFKLGEKEFCSYEINSGTLFKRYVLFTAENHYYECEASTMKGEWKQPLVTELFVTQQSILASLHIVLGLP